MPFKCFGLSDPLVRGILATGYTAPTEIQSKALPAAIAGQDVIGCAQTGTGKTAAFVLPILNRLGHERGGSKIVRALILTPTRELAAQIEDCIESYGRFLHLKSLAIYGGVSINNQLGILRRGVDIVVATPGRLIDHIQRGSINLKHIEVLVLDEADRMFDMGFINDVRKIIGFLPKERQTMLFSATISKEVRALAQGVQKSPKMIQVGQERKPIETITQRIYPVKKELKPDLLLYMLKNRSMYSVLVFSRTKHGADKIARRLQKEEIVSAAIHSDKTQAQRQRVLEGFKKGKYQVLIATDIAARGIDVAGITHVVNYDVPNFAEDYVHRIGRTGRAEHEGEAITFVSPDENAHLRSIEKFIERKFTMEKCEGFSYRKTEPANPHAPQQHEPKEEREYSEERPQRQPQHSHQPRGGGYRGHQQNRGQHSHQSHGGYKGGRPGRGQHPNKPRGDYRENKPAKPQQRTNAPQGQQQEHSQERPKVQHSHQQHQQPRGAYKGNQPGKPQQSNQPHQAQGAGQEGHKPSSAKGKPGWLSFIKKKFKK
ncbi:MAG: DEAD/DEAH box helicase [Phycisphaerae bacterium]